MKISCFLRLWNWRQKWCSVYYGSSARTTVIEFLMFMLWIFLRSVKKVLKVHRAELFSVAAFCNALELKNCTLRQNSVKFRKSKMHTSRSDWKMTDFACMHSEYTSVLYTLFRVERMYRWSTLWVSDFSMREFSFLLRWIC